MGELLDSIEWQSVEALNQNPAHPVSNALKQVPKIALALPAEVGRVLLIKAARRMMNLSTLGASCCLRTWQLAHSQRQLTQ